MHGSTRTPKAVHQASIGISAAVWIEPGRALVVRGGDGAEHASLVVELPVETAMTPPVLAEVAHSIGQVDKVLVMGQDDLRTALEREIVAIGHRPETIREARPSGPMDEAALLERLRRLR